MSKPALVIPDTHQNIDWVNAILAKEAPSVSQIIFLGDYLDRKVTNAAAPSQTARFIAELPKRLPKHRLTFLVGNHDLPYLFDLQNDRHPDSPLPNPYSNGAYIPSYSQQVAPYFTAAFLQRIKPFALVEGYLLSHAGLHKSHLPAPSESSLEKLGEKLEDQIRSLPRNRPPELAAIGTARKGPDPIGGLTWQDWFQEFEDSLPWPQIVGHTLIDEPNQKGRSWNLDTHNGSYALIQNSNIEIRSLPK